MLGRFAFDPIETRVVADLLARILHVAHHDARRVWLVILSSDAGYFFEPARRIERESDDPPHRNRGRPPPLSVR